MWCSCQVSVQEELVFSGVLSRSAKEDVIKCRGKVGGGHVRYTSGNVMGVGRQ